MLKYPHVCQMVNANRPEAPDIVAENAVVLDIDTIECDLSIPQDAAVGYYDVKVTVGGDISGVGESIFMVATPDPTGLVDITPEWVNFRPHS